MVKRLFLAVPRGCLQFVIVVFPDHTHYFVDLDSKGFGESAHLQGLSEPSFLDTAMGTSTKSNVLVHLIYSLLLVIIYLA